MQKVRELSVKDYTYDLPEDRIAKFPLEKRDQSKLLFFRDEKIHDHHFTDLPQLLQKNDLLIFNDTKVIRARILFQRSTGSTIEVFCLEPADGKDPAIAFQQKRSSRWNALVGNAKRWKEKFLSLPLLIHNEQILFTAKIESRQNDHFVILFEWNSEHAFSEIIEAAGQLPIPPYLNRKTEEEDLIRYQTVYARFDGSVAAPTAGLHFTPAVFSELKKREIETAFVTLHVGAGTFRPVKSDTMAEHDMHEEKIVIHVGTLKKIQQHLLHGRIIAVGTTSMRTLESLYWFGVNLSNDQDAEFKINQWTPYEEQQQISSLESLTLILKHMENKRLTVLQGSTSILIAPGYTFHFVKGLITNFHQPNSTLLLLVSAFIGEKWRTLYDHALAHSYRFLSYGDSSLLLK